MQFCFPSLPGPSSCWHPSVPSIPWHVDCPVIGLDYQARGSDKQATLLELAGRKLAHHCAQLLLSLASKPAGSICRALFTTPSLWKPCLLPHATLISSSGQQLPCPGPAGARAPGVVLFPPWLLRHRRRWHARPLSLLCPSGSPKTLLTG